MSLKQAIARLYDVMRVYRGGAPVEGCPHCIGDADHRSLHGALDTLGPDALARYAWKAMTTWGDANDFRGFLPRLLELVTTGHGGSIDEGVLLGKLPYGEWRSWPTPEQDAIEAVLHAWWRDTLATEPAQAPSRVAVLARTAEALHPYLEAWSADGTVASTFALAELVNDHQGELWKRGRFHDRRYSDAQAKELTDWLLSPETTARLELAFFANAPAPEAAALSAAVDVLAAVPRAR